MSPHRRILIVTAALALAFPTLATAAPNKTDADRFDKAPSAGKVGTSGKPAALAANKKIKVMVELAGDPVAVAEAKASRTFSKSERNGLKQKLRKAQNSISGDIAAKGGKVLSRMQSAYNGMQVQIASSKVDSLASLPGVAGVHAITVQTLDNTVSVPYLGVPQVWQDTGKTGKGVKVAIIDTGIDYTHATFNGPGTPEAYATAHAAEAAPADPALFGPGAPRVKGGHDFVGDAYDPAPTDGSDPVPAKPDPNPLDCQGHGSHVAGTAGGGGVTADGAAFTGPYNASMSATDFKVGPGVAPEVDLYGLRVFGCEGGTDLTTEAIDWAVDQGMDVINMSLGSPFGRADDPSAVAASNAVGAGVVVVTSAGNSGPNPYITGAPGVGEGVIAVAAVDSIPNFAGAELSFDGKTLSAININGADLPSGDFEIVYVSNDPGTPVDESLGCSESAYTGAGISGAAGAPKQVAVVTRGDCARAAKPIFGQQAGADAVIMVNNAPDYPPFEGPILSNPDDGTPFTVTIPFLGVRNTDGAALQSADGTSLTMVAAELANPAFKGLWSFSSGGPRNGDSGISPNVAAPGVSISSTAVGTGNGSAILSGTSMAAPHVAGVAALGVQAHPTWPAQDVAAAVVSSADPEKVDGYQVTLSGTGLVDAAQVVKTSAFATGDRYRTTSGTGREASLSFGFAEPRSSFVGTKVLTLTNRGRFPVTYRLGYQPSTQSIPAKVSLSRRTVRVPAHGSVQVRVKLTVAAGSVGSSIGGEDQFGFREASGNIVASSPAGDLRVPYLLVPRAQANVTASLSKDPGPVWNTDGKGGQTKPVIDDLTVKLSNPGGALNADARFYTWGLSDRRDVSRDSGGSGYDLRAAGVRTVETPDGELLVFAVNNYDRWSNAATNQFDVAVDTNGDGEPEYFVYSLDSGYVRTGIFNGLTEVFIYDVKAGGVSATGFLAQAPTDSSTILLPVMAADLGLTAGHGNFKYTVSSFSIEGPWGDEFTSWASYDPWARAIADGDHVTVARNGRQTVTVAVDPVKFADQRPKGVMVVVFDNKSGAREALLLGVH